MTRHHGEEQDPRAWIEQIDGPAALLGPSPWRFTPNAALQSLLGLAPLSQDALGQAFGAGGGELAARLAQGLPFGGRLRFEMAPAPAALRLLQADFAPLPGGEHWLCTLVDLSAIERQRQRRALTLERLQHTLDQLQELVSLIDHEETVLFINASYARFFGTTRDEAVGQPLKRVMGDNHALTAPSRRELFRTRQPVRYERILLDNQGEDRVMGILLWPILGGQGQVAKMATLTRDVTLRHRGMQALRQTLDRLDALFEAGIEGIVLCDQGVISDANPIACRLFGAERERLVGQPLAQALHALGVPPSACLPGEGGLPGLQLSLRPGEDGTPPLQLQAITVSDEDQPCEALLLQDMSYRYQAQQRIARLVSDLRWQTSRAETADRSKSVFLASASHDLRQPIHALGLFLSTIQSLCRAPPPLVTTPFLPIVQRMRASLDGLMQLLDMLLGASLRDAGQQPLSLRPMALQPVFDELVSEFGAAAADKGLALRALRSRAWVYGDHTVLRRVLANLVSNAVRYTPHGRVLLGARPRGTELEIQVWDTGIGIPPEQLETIFQEFYRVPVPPGRSGERSEGLGLAIVRRAAAELGARPHVRSVPGHGSVFSLRLTRSAPQTREESSEAVASAPISSGRHILLIDDDEQVLLATASLLESWGHHVTSAPDAREALRLCESQAQRVDILICDYMLDPSMDGLELLLRLRLQRPGPLPVCMVTGDMSAERIEQAQRHGFTLLHKPVGAQTLRRFLQEVA